MVEGKGEEETVSSVVFDGLGRIKSLRDPNQNASKEPKNTYTYEYTKEGLLSKETNAIGNVTEYHYNANLLLEKMKDSAGDETIYSYDSLNRVTSVADDVGTITYTYDANGNITDVKETKNVVEKLVNTGSTIHREFDCLNRITSYTDYQGRTVEYDYDNLGNLKTLTYPGGEIVTYTYNGDGSIATMTSNSGGTLYTWEYGYDRYGRLEKITRPDGTVENRVYDDAGNLEHQEDVNKDGTKVQENDYTYNVFGEVIEKKTLQDGDLSTLEVVTMTYDDANRLKTYCLKNGDEQEVIYDAKGNMVKGPVDGVIQKLEYDCRNRLISAGGVTYTYDAENTRIATTENGKTTEYVTDTGGSLSKLLVAYESDGSETHYYYGAEGLSGQYNSKAKEGLFYHFDNIGSTTCVTNILGIAVANFAYGTYGELLSTVEKGIRFLYNGAYGVTTDSNGLYYMRARYYNPDIKRFINQDIKVGDIGNSQSLNRYAYCEGNPVSLIDPFGLSPEGTQSADDINWLSEIAHLALGLGGLFEGVGSLFDLADAALYFYEGDPLSGTLSVVSAIPVVGLFVGVGKIGAKTIKIGGYIADVLRNSNKFRHTVDAIVTATSNFRKILHSGATDVMSALIAKGRDAAKIIQKGSEGFTELTGMIKRQGEKIYTSIKQSVQRLKGGSSSIPTQGQMHDAVTQWAKMKQSIASNRQLNKFKTATVVFDSGSGKYYYGMNRGIRMKGDEIDDVLLSWLPEKSLNHLPVGNCAEVDAVNQALKAKANVNDLYLYTIDVETYLPKAMCDNCIYTFADRVAKVFSH